MVAGFGLVGIAVGAGVDLVVKLNKSLAETATLAERVGLSTDKLQQIRFAANSFGVGDDDVNSGLDKFASNLQDAKFLANDLTRAFEANSVAIKDANGKQKDTNVLLQSAFDIIRRAASVQDAIQLGGFFGFGKEFSQSLKDAGSEFDDLMGKANAAGAIIDKNTIQKAKEFDAEWRKATTIWASNIKSAANDVLPSLNDLVNLFAKGLKIVNSLYVFAKESASFFLESVFPTDFSTKSTQELDTLIAKYTELREKVARGKKLTPNESLSFTNFQTGPGQSNTEILDSLIDRLKSAKTAADAAAGSVKQVVNNEKPSNNPGPSQGGESNDAVDRAINSLRRHTEQVDADARAVGLGAEALARFRAQALETSAVQANGGKETAEQAAKFKELQDKAAAAADALARARIASQISRGAQTAFLTPEDLQIAQQLAVLFGDNIPAALNSSYAAQLKFNETMRQLGQLGQEVNRSVFTDFAQQIRNGATAMDALRTAGVNALGKIADKLISMAADNLWAAAFGGTSGGLGGFFGSLFKGGGGGAPVGEPLNILPKFASGTNSAPGGMALVGERSPELVNLPRGSQVIPNDVLQRAGGGVSVTFAPNIDARGADVAAVARLEQVVTRQQQEFEARVVGVVRGAQSRRVLR